MRKKTTAPPITEEEQEKPMHECLCSRHSELQSVTMQSYPRGATGASRLTSHHIIYILSGTAHYYLAGEGSSLVLRAGQFVFLPVGTNLRYEALDDLELLKIRLNDMVGKISECNTFRFQRISDASAVPSQVGAYPLTANSRIEHFIEGLVQTERDGLKCASYAQLVVGQLLYLIQVYYPQQEYLRFYSTILSPDVVFSDFVRDNWMTLRTVNELAEALNMTTQQFTLRFRKVFGCTPGTWLQQRKAECIYHDICSSHKPLKSIAAAYDFSMANFIRYSRMNFGASPGAIRATLTVPADGSPIEGAIQLSESVK